MRVRLWAQPVFSRAPNTSPVRPSLPPSRSLPIQSWWSVLRSSRHAQCCCRCSHRLRRVAARGAAYAAQWIYIVPQEPPHYPTEHNNFRHFGSGLLCRYSGDLYCIILAMGKKSGTSTKDVNQERRSTDWHKYAGALHMHQGTPIRKRRTYREVSNSDCSSGCCEKGAAAPPEDGMRGSQKAVKRVP